MNKDELNDAALMRYLEWVREKTRDKKEKMKEVMKKSEDFFDLIFREKQGESEWDEQLEKFYAPLFSLIASSPEGIRVFKDAIINKEILDYFDIFNPELNRMLNSKIKMAYLYALPEAMIADTQMENEREMHVRSNIKAQGIVSSFLKFKTKKNKQIEDWTD